MQSYPFEIINGLCFIQLDGKKVLVSTGTPESMCWCGDLVFEGRSFRIKHQTLRMNPDSLSEALGTPVDALLGADILSRFDYRISPFSREITVSTDEIHPYGYAYHFDLYRSVPVVSIWVDSKETKVFFNTGSRITCLIPEIVKKYPKVGDTRVYYPGIGWFSTPLHRILIWMSGNDVELDVGIPPDALMPTLASMRAEGVLGCDVLLGPGVFLASRRREVIWFWHDY